MGVHMHALRECRIVCLGLESVSVKALDMYTWWQRMANIPCLQDQELEKTASLNKHGATYTLIILLGPSKYYPIVSLNKQGQGNHENKGPPMQGRILQPKTRIMLQPD